MGKIVVGVDGSQTSVAALRWAIREARAHGWYIAAVHAWHIPSSWWMDMAGVEGMRSPDASSVRDVAANETRLAEQERRGADSVIEQALTEALQGEELDVEVQHRLIEGSATEALIAEAKGASLLVVGSRGRGGFAELLLGSVSHQVAHHAPCPVVIIPPSAV